MNARAETLIRQFSGSPFEDISRHLSAIADNGEGIKECLSRTKALPADIEKEFHAPLTRTCTVFDELEAAAQEYSPSTGQQDGLSLSGEQQMSELEFELDEISRSLSYIKQSLDQLRRYSMDMLRPLPFQLRIDEPDQANYMKIMVRDSSDTPSHNLDNRSNAKDYKRSSRFSRLLSHLTIPSSKKQAATSIRSAPCEPCDTPVSPSPVSIRSFMTAPPVVTSPKSEIEQFVQAASAGDWETLSVLNDRHKELKLVEAKWQSSTGLSAAVHGQHWQIVRMLVKIGSDPLADVVDPEQPYKSTTPLRMTIARSIEEADYIIHQVSSGLAQHLLFDICKAPESTAKDLIDYVLHQMSWQPKPTDLQRAIKYARSAPNKDVLAILLLCKADSLNFTPGATFALVGASCLSLARTKDQISHWSGFNLETQNPTMQLLTEANTSLIVGRTTDKASGRDSSRMPCLSPQIFVLKARIEELSHLQVLSRSCQSRSPIRRNMKSSEIFQMANRLVSSMHNLFVLDHDFPDVDAVQYEREVLAVALRLSQTIIEQPQWCARPWGLEAKDQMGREVVMLETRDEVGIWLESDVVEAFPGKQWKHSIELESI